MKDVVEARQCGCRRCMSVIEPKMAWKTKSPTGMRDVEDVVDRTCA